MTPRELHLVQSPCPSPSSSSPCTGQRIAGERKTAASIFAQAKTASVSIPVKPISAYGKTYKRDVTAHAIGRKPSPRQAAALAVAAAAAGIKISDGATFPRKFEMRGAAYAIENGALSDAMHPASAPTTPKRKQSRLPTRRNAQAKRVAKLSASNPHGAGQSPCPHPLSPLTIGNITMHNSKIKFAKLPKAKSDLRTIAAMLTANYLAAGNTITQCPLTVTPAKLSIQ